MRQCPDVDLVIEQPTLRQRATVQVKSRASQAVLDDHLERFRRSGEDCTFFVCHSCNGALAVRGEPRAHLWTGDQLTELAVKNGLYDWLVERAG